MSKLHELCAEYGFCTPETRAELEKNGFNFSVCKFGITTAFTDNIVIRTQHESDQIYQAMEVVPYPTFTEVWRMLIPAAKNHKAELVSDSHNGDFFVFSKREVLNPECKPGDTLNTRLAYYYQSDVIDENYTDALCGLWLQLKKGGFLNG